MAVCLGLDLTPRDWLLSEVRSSAGETAVASRPPISPAGLGLGGLFPLLDVPLVQALDDILRHREDWKPGPGGDDDRLTADLKLFMHPRIVEGVDAWAMAHPYRTSPPVRRMLPELFGVRRINALRDVIERRHVSIEGPLAAALQILVAEAMPLPAQLLILHGTQTLAELTAVRMTASGSQLHLEVLAFCELTPDDDAALTGFRDRLKAQPAATWRLRTIGDHLQPHASRVARALDIAAAQSKVDPPDSAARGAARYALLKLERNLYGAPFDRLAIQRITPRVVGLYGVNERNEAYWHRLFPAGTQLPAQAAIRLTGQEVVSHIVLCESPSAVCDQSAWLPSQAWAQQPRQLYSLYFRTWKPGLEGKASQLHIEILPPRDFRSDPGMNVKMTTLAADSAQR